MTRHVFGLFLIAIVILSFETGAMGARGRRPAARVRRPVVKVRPVVRVVRPVVKVRRPVVNVRRPVVNIRRPVIHVPGNVINVRRPVVNIPGQVINLKRPVVNVPGQVINVPGHVINLKRPVVNVPGQVINVPGHVINVKRPVVNIPGHVINLPAQVINVPQTVVNIPKPEINIPPPVIITPAPAPIITPAPVPYNPPAVVTTPKPCPALADIVFVIDASGSLGPDNYYKEQDFATDIAARFPIGPNGARFACIIFSSTAEVAFRLSDYSDQSSLGKALNDLPYLNTTTHTFKAFDLLYDEQLFAPENGGRKDAAKIIIFLTDGRSSNPVLTAESAQRLKDEGATILSIGIGDYSLDELKAVASDDKNVFTASSFLVLEKIKQQVAARACEVPRERRRYRG